MTAGMYIVVARPDRSDLDQTPPWHACGDDAWSRAKRMARARDYLRFNGPAYSQRITTVDGITCMVAADGKAYPL